MQRNVVLFVDDEPKVLSSLQRELLEEKYKCIFVESGSKALEVMEKQEISVIVTDMKMPVMNGLDLLKKAKELYPDTVRIVLSGYTQLSQLLVTINQGDIFRFIPKPWNLDEEFKPIIEEAIKHYNSLMEEKKRISELENKFTVIDQEMALLKSENDTCRDELARLKLSSIYLINNIKEKIKKSPELDNQRLADNLELKSQIYMDYLNNHSSLHKNFHLKQLIIDSQSQINNKYGEEAVNITLDNGIEVLSNYDLLRFVILSIYKIIIKINSNLKIPISISTEQKGDNVALHIITKAYFENDQNKSEQSLIIEEVKEYTAFLERIVRILNGSFSVHQVENNIYLKTQISLQLKL